MDKLSSLSKTDHNKLLNVVSWINKRPAWIRSWLLTTVFNRTVKMAGTVGIEILRTDGQTVTLRLRNRSKAQNHIKGVHAAGMALLAESASGFIFGLHVPDNKLPLLKSMELDYVSRAKGDLQATASITAEQVANIESQEKGNVNVTVTIVDSENTQPVICKMQWAWITKKR